MTVRSLTPAENEMKFRVLKKHPDDLEKRVKKATVWVLDCKDRTKKFFFNGTRKTVFHPMTELVKA